MLHLINQSPMRTNHLQSCLRLLQPSDAILFFEDGVYAVKINTDITPLVKEAMQTAAIYALQPDLKARGLEEMILDGVKIIDYDGFVDLTIEYKVIHSWH